MPDFQCPCGTVTKDVEGPFVCPGCGKKGAVLPIKPARPVIATAMLKALESSMEQGDFCRFRYDDYELAEQDEDAPNNAANLIHFDGTIDVMKFFAEWVRQTSK